MTDKKKFIFHSTHGEEIVVNCCNECPFLHLVIYSRGYYCKPNNNWRFKVPVKSLRDFFSTLDERHVQYLGGYGFDGLTISGHCPAFNPENFKSIKGLKHWRES